ncbi:MAG TPA: NifU family protein [Actinomycetaceae bacterium]|nr:NifU family protein [Actinomycetaceae bacterium]
MTAAPAALLPIHAETVPGDDGAVRWVVPAAVVPGRGLVTRAPEPVARLMRAGARLTCEAGSVVVELGEGESWREWGEPVRLALFDALGRPEEWETAAPADLATALREVLAGETGEFVRSHGGTVRVVAVDGDDATVELGGTCSGCPLRGVTLHQRIGAAVREHYPGLGRLTVTAPKPTLWPRPRRKG